MRQDQLDGFVTFMAVAEQCNFTLAAQRLGVSPSAVSQAIRALEKRLGVALFNRTTRSVRLTEPGQQFLKRIRPLVLELSHAVEALADSVAAPSGLLRLVATTPAYLTVLRPAMPGFFAQYPNLDLEVSVNQAKVDIVRDGFDAGISLGSQVERDMVALNVGPRLSMLVVAGPGYLERHGTPKHPHDLLGHDCIAYRQLGGGPVERWQFDNGRERFHLSIRGRLLCDDPAAQLQAALDNLGIAYLASGHVGTPLKDGQLVQLLAEWSHAAAQYVIYFPSRRRIPARLRLLIDHIRGTEPADL